MWFRQPHYFLLILLSTLRVWHGLLQYLFDLWELRLTKFGITVIEGLSVGWLTKINTPKLLFRTQFSSVSCITQLFIAMFSDGSSLEKLFCITSCKDSPFVVSLWEECELPVNCPPVTIVTFKRRFSFNEDSVI